MVTNAAHMCVWFQILAFLLYLVLREEGFLRDFRWVIRLLSSVVKSAALKKSGYPKVPGSNPAENTSTQIRMDLSK